MAWHVSNHGVLGQNVWMIWTDHEKIITTVGRLRNFISNLTTICIFFGPIKSRLIQINSVRRFLNRSRTENLRSSLTLYGWIAWKFWLRKVDIYGRKQRSRVMRKPTICICENKDADQLRGNREADQRLCFRYLDSTIPLLPKYKISSLEPSPVAVQPGLCQTWSESTLLVFSCCGSKDFVQLIYTFVYAYAKSRFSYNGS